MNSCTSCESPGPLQHGPPRRINQLLSTVYPITAFVYIIRVIICITQTPIKHSRMNWHVRWSPTCKSPSSPTWIARSRGFVSLGVFHSLQSVFLFPFFVILSAIGISFCFLVYNHSFADALARLFFLLLPKQRRKPISQLCLCAVCVRACVRVGLHTTVVDAVIDVLLRLSTPPLRLTRVSLSVVLAA